MGKTKYNISEAARIVGVSRTTIQRAINAKRNKLSYELDDNGNKLIDASELTRRYGNKCNFDRAETNGEPEPKAAPSDESVHKKLIKQYEDQIADLRGQVAELNNSLAKALDVPKLLEDHSSKAKDAWQSSIDEMTEKITNDVEGKHKEHEEKLNVLSRRFTRKQLLRRLIFGEPRKKNKAGEGHDGQKIGT